MIVITRKVAKKGKSYSIYGDRNSIVIKGEDGLEIVTFALRSVKGNEVIVAIDAPKHLTVVRKELITNDRGVEYEKRKSERDLP